LEWIKDETRHSYDVTCKLDIKVYLNYTKVKKVGRNFVIVLIGSFVKFSFTARILIPTVILTFSLVRS